MKKVIKFFIPKFIIRKIINLRTKIYDKYDGVYQRFFLDIVIGQIENLTYTYNTNRAFSGYKEEGKSLQMSYLIATSSKGLLKYQSGKVDQLISGKGYYGLTCYEDTWFAFHKTGFHGRIISFKLTNGKITDITTKIWGLSRGIHQIDLIDKDTMAVVDTYNNCILEYKNFSKLNNCNWRSYTKKIYPNGKLTKGRRSANYNHFNSIYKYDNQLYVIAHNATSKTKRKSELYVLDLDYGVIEVKEINGSNCHNIYKDDQMEIICKSGEGTVQVNGNDQLDVDLFTRGVSISEDYFIFGGSEISNIRNKRDRTNGKIFITDKKFQILTSQEIFQTQISEIRRVDHVEYTLSSVKDSM